MTIAWFLPLIFYATLNLAAGKDLGPIIRIAQCRSICLQTHGIAESKCENETDSRDYQQCWYSCNVLEHLKKEVRHNVCEKRNFQNLTISSDWPEKTLNQSTNSSENSLPLAHRAKCLGCETACWFFQTKEMEMETYDASKLPAPEEGEIHMNKYDVAVVMEKDERGTWIENGYYSVKQRPTLAPLEWIIVVDEKGAIRHYSWEKWWPTLHSVVAGSVLDQAYITWYDWRSQLRQQRSTKLKTLDPSKLELLNRKEGLSRPSYVVTWQQEMGYGITGNQVTKSESAAISLPPGNKYLVRIASSDGPGSYPIGIWAKHWTEIQITVLSLQLTLIDWIMTLLVINAILVLLMATLTLRHGFKIKILVETVIKNVKAIQKDIQRAIDDGYDTELERVIIKSLSKLNMKTESSVKDIKVQHTITDSVIVDIANDDNLKTANKSTITHQHTGTNTMNVANTNIK